MPVRQAKPITPTVDEVPVTRGMLAGVRVEVLQRIDQAREEAKADNQRLEGKIDAVKAELKADNQRLEGKIDAVKAELKADNQRLEGKIDAVKAELKADNQRLEGKIDALGAELKAEIHEIKAEIHEIKAEVHEIKANVARITVIVEEQDARNKVALDAATAMFSRQGRVEQQLTEMMDLVRSIAAARPTG